MAVDKRGQIIDIVVTVGNPDIKHRPPGPAAAGFDVFGASR